MAKRVMVTKYGFAVLEGTDEEVLEKAKNMSDSDFDWSDPDDPMIHHTCIMQGKEFVAIWITSCTWGQ